VHPLPAYAMRGARAVDWQWKEDALKISTTSNSKGVFVSLSTTATRFVHVDIG
jgi:hypothetical protein